MARRMPILVGAALCAAAWTLAAPQSVGSLAGPALSGTARPATNLNSSKSNASKARPGRKGAQTGPAGIAVSDPGAEGSKGKPTKSK